MIARAFVIAAFVLVAGTALSGTTVADNAFVPEVLVPAQAGDTCDGWPAPVGKVFDECPHGPTI